MRRAAFTVLAAAAAVLAVPTAAFAEATVTFRSPEPGATVSAPVDLIVDVERRLVDPHPSTVVLELSADGVEPHPEASPVELQCVENCEGEATVTTSRWQGPKLAPTTLAPFDGAPACNGRWWLLPSVSPGPTQVADASHGAFVVSRPPASVRDLSVAVEDRDVVLHWTRAPQDDISGYRVERSSDGGPWKGIATLEPASTTYRQSSVADGSYDYRVVSLRPDGSVDDEPAPACEDTGHDLETASSAWRVNLSSQGGTVAPSEPNSPSPSPSQSGSEEEATNGAGNDGTGGSGSANGSSSARQRIASGSGSSGQLAAPQTQAPRVAAPRDSYFGQDGPFSDRLDYEGVNAVIPGDEYAMERVPGGMIEVFGRELDMAHILRPVAGGLVLMGFGLHLRRWMRT